MERGFRVRQRAASRTLVGNPRRVSNLSPSNWFDRRGALDRRVGVFREDSSIPILSSTEGFQRNYSMDRDPDGKQSFGQVA